jgi:flagellin-specific chaperone FliS
LGEDECHVNASVSPGWNWHIYWEEAGFVARLGTLGLYLGPEAYSAAVETINHLAQFFPDIRDKDRLDREMRGSLYDALDDLYHYQVGAWPT